VSDRSAVAGALARKRLLPFLMMAFSMQNPEQENLQPAWYLKAMCTWLERIAAGKLQRSMIWIQPRTLKSFTVAIVFPCWLLGLNPSAKIMVATYGERLSREHAQKRRQIMESDLYKRLFPNTVIALRGNTADELRTTRGGYCLSVSVGGPVTGRGADYIILDDCMKTDEHSSEAAREGVKSWFSTALSTRLNDKRTGSIVSIQQRIHEDDLPAMLLDKKYELLRLPAVADKDMQVEIAEGLFHYWKRGELLDPVRFPQEVLDYERLSSGPQVYSAQYLQDPVAPGGNLIKMDQFGRFEKSMPRECFDRVIQSWDPAASEAPTADYSACTTWGYVAGRMFLIDVFQARMDYPKLKSTVIAKKKAFEANVVIIERSSNGIALCQQLTQEGPFRPVSWPPPGIRQLDKAERLISQTGQIEEGRVWLPAQLEGLDSFMKEIRAFPHGKYDDQLDTLTQLLEYSFWHWKALMREYNEEGRPIKPIRGRRPPLPKLPDWIG
jgi:predicted phage terminase large subunit-like protein